MARGDKNYDKVVRGVNKGQKAEKKKKAIHKMVESLIKGESEEAAEQLHNYLQIKSRELILGEAEDEKEEKGEDEKEESDEDEKEESDEDEKEESDEDEKEEDSDEEKE